MHRVARAVIGAFALILLAGVFAARPAAAYEFWLRTRTIGQAYQLREFRLSGPDLFLGRRRYTQSLALRIWDIGDFALERRRAHLPERGIRISWQSYLRIDHDFGTYSTGRIQLPTSPTARRDALDVIPELGESVAGIALLYGFVQLDGMFDDRLQLQIGRTLPDDGWGTTSVDGATARFELPQPIAISASAGLRVRAASPLGVAAYELDGTSGAGCREFVEGTAPGTGAWQLIDRSRAITNTKLTSDYEYCPQREVRQPTIGITIATSRLRRFGAELGYRRTSSATVGLIGSVDRLDNPDLGLYPSSAPASGVNEERLWTRVHAELRAASLAIAPYAAARYSLLHATVDRAELGVRLTRGDHVLEPALEYFYPTFDGDSIFNAFSIEPTTDARLGYRFAPAGPWRGVADAWVRRYHHEEGSSSVAGGVDAGLERALGERWRGRINALADGGYGGRRIGGSSELAWHPDADHYVRARALVLGLREDGGLLRNTVTSSGVVSATWHVAETVAIHAIGQVDYDDVHDLQTRAIAILDFAFAPEP